VPEPIIDPLLISRAEAAVAKLESALCDVQVSFAGIHAALLCVYPLDTEREGWFAAWETGSLGVVWDRLERLNIQDVIDAALF